MSTPAFPPTGGREEAYISLAGGVRLCLDLLGLVLQYICLVVIEQFFVESFGVLVALRVRALWPPLRGRERLVLVDEECCLEDGVKGNKKNCERKILETRVGTLAEEVLRCNRRRVSFSVARCGNSAEYRMRFLIRNMGIAEFGFCQMQNVKLFLAFRKVLI